MCTSWKCFNIYVHECVYKPAEDSILALEALRILYERGFKYEEILDLGTGTGILALGAYELFKPHMLTAIDISPYAIRTARCNLPPEAHIIQCDKLKCFNKRDWDLIILNPPYLPEEPRGNKGSCDWWLELSWSGGGDVMRELVIEALNAGREVILVHSTLSPISLEELEEKAEIEILTTQRFFYEELKALRLKPRS